MNSASQPLTAMTRPIRVAVVDDHPMVREGTCLSLAQAPGLELVGSAETGEAALQLVAETPLDVLVLDVHLPDVSGIEVVRQLRAAHANVKVLILTGYDDAGYVKALLQLGIKGYLRKTATAGEIVAAVKTIAAGQTVLVHGRTLLESEYTHPSRALAEHTEPLTAREIEVLRLLASAHRNDEIARLLSLSVKTVEFHVGHILEKFRARSRAEAIYKARQQGLA